MKNPQTYLPYDPAVVGGPGITLVLGPSSGRAAFAARFASLGLGLNPGAESEVIRRMKEADRAEWDDPDALLRTKVAEVGV
jgi:isopropylmalate/homocitrate/citramalate synthase